MNEFEAALTQSIAELTSVDVAVMLPRMLAAAIIGASLATRPWRLLTGQPMPRSEMIQAQILLCAAAAVITAVIGNSLAKAFGLVGLGGFVRFRSGLKDPRDAAILFLLIGLGMACGHGSLGLALVGTIFVAVLLITLDLISRKKDAAPPLTLQADTEDPAATETALRKAFTSKNVLVKTTSLDFPKKRLEVEVEGIEADRLMELLSKGADGPLRSLRWTVSPRDAEKKLKEEPA